MSNDTVIDVRNLSKKYRRYSSVGEAVKEVLHPLRRKYHQEFWALKDVSFSVKKGESVGIIGRNGSGKSTLLQILCGIMQPTKGDVAVLGRVAALLELGAGFHPQFTGRENVHLNCSLMGFSRQETEKRFSSIVEFADIGDFIDQPVRTYSSGMYVRLAFSTAISVEPDILIVDEALGVGDIGFQQKCLRKFEEFQDKGITVLFVTHDMPTIKKNCQKALLLDRGELIDSGSPTEVIDVYNALIFEKIAAEAGKSNEISGKELVARKNTGGSQQYGTKEAVITEVLLLNGRGERITAVGTLEQSEIKIRAFFNEDITDVLVGINIRNRHGIEVYMVNTEWKGMPIPRVNKNNILEVSFSQKMSIAPGSYSLTVSLSQNTSFGVKRLDWISDILAFDVVGLEKMAGVSNLDSKINVEIQPGIGIK